MIVQILIKLISSLVLVLVPHKSYADATLFTAPCLPEIDKETQRLLAGWLLAENFFRIMKVRLLLRAFSRIILQAKQAAQVFG